MYTLGMEGAPKNPTPNSAKEESVADKLRKAATIATTVASIGVAAASPVNKVAAMPTDGAPLTTEKQVVRPKDLDDQVLKDEIDANRAVFEISESGEIKRIAGNS